MKRCMIGIFFGALILTLSVYMYLCMAFPDDVVEDVVQEISCNDRKVVIGKRGGGATVGYYYVVYDGKSEPKNVVVVVKDLGREPEIKRDDNGCVIVHVDNIDSIVRCREDVLVEENGDGGVLIRLQ